MKTVLTDRSLSMYTLAERVDPKHIFGYISALRDAGIRYIEMDFRTVMKMQELPDGVKYIFRVTDPAVAYLSEAFDFDYVLVSINDLRHPLQVSLPVIAEIPGSFITPVLVALLREQTRGKLAMVRIRDSFPMMTQVEALQLVNRMRASVTVPVDFCPTNDRRTALDTAIKLSLINADSVSMCMGKNNVHASIEEFMFTLLSVYDTIPKEFDISALCRAAVLHQVIFRNRPDSISEIMKLLDRDISGLINADTGERVRMHVALRDSQFLRKTFVSALEKLAKEENIPPDIMQDMTNAIHHFNMELFDEELLKPQNKGLLN